MSSSDQTKKMPQLNGQSSKKQTQSAMLKEYSIEYDHYSDFLINDPTSNPQHPHQVGQFVRQLDKVLGNAGRGNTTGGKPKI